MLQFFVNLKAGTPIYEQVVMAVKKAIVEGQLRVGQAFPSVREISKELRINPNTAQKIVSKLIQEKLLEVRPGIGTVVTENSSHNKELVKTILGDRLEQLIVEARTVGISEKQFIESAQKVWNQSSKRLKP